VDMLRKRVFLFVFFGCFFESFSSREKRLG